MSEPAAAPAEAPEPTLPEDLPVPPELDDDALTRAAIAAHRAAAAEPPAAPPVASEPAVAPPAQPAAAPAAEPAAEPAVPPPATPPAGPSPAELQRWLDAQAAEQRARQEAAEAARAAKAEADAAKAELERLKQRLATQPLDALREVAGFDLESLNRHAVTGKTPEAVALARMQQRLDQVEQERAQERAAAQQAQLERDQQAAQHRLITETIPQALRPDAAKFPKLTAAYDPEEVHGMVFNVMRDAALRAQQNPGSGVRVPTPSEAAALLEAQLVARLKRLDAPVSGNPAPTEVKQPVANPSPSAPRGLSNAQTPAKPPPANDLDDLSDEALDRKALEALAANPIPRQA